MDISFQLYSAREFPPVDGMIEALAGFGYSQVEGFGGVYGDLPALRATLDANGVSMPSGHFMPLGQFEDRFDETLAAAKTLGMRRLYCPAPEGGFVESADAAAWIALAGRLEAVAGRAEDAGLRFGWHNHHWEFMELPGGEIPMALMLEHAPSIDWQADVAWIARAGADPLDWIAGHGERIGSAHVKDIAPEGESADEDGWADVGHGVMDWPAIMKALRETACELYVMEHDKPSDAIRFAKRSIANFRNW